ncbi:MAG: 4Fe-4S dicluster domain-containing protein [candidate division KSB1 bacterium]|nr:4Fe-4S dicluster domain-containing protein [candidate division KSB1 bacterium]
MTHRKLDFNFRQRLNKILGGEHHNYCYQCGACVAACPAARFSDNFNPRDVLLKTLIGDEEDLIRPDSIIWKCTNCYSCYERCPQDVRPVEVIIALKNLCAQEGVLPEDINKFSETLVKTGRSVVITSTVNRRRQELGLPELKDVNVAELQTIIE